MPSNETASPTPVAEIETDVIRLVARERVEFEEMRAALATREIEQDAIELFMARMEGGVEQYDDDSVRAEAQDLYDAITRARSSALPQSSEATDRAEN